MRVKQSFAAVVREHGPVVMRVCRAVLGPVDADDAWSETFLSAMKAYPDLPLDANLQAWLVTIAHRKAIDVTRSRSRQPTPTETLPDTPTHPPKEPDEALALALSRLPPKQKTAVAYHYLAGLPYAEVAEILGGTAAAARRAAADGIATLRRTYRGAVPTTHPSSKGATS